MFRSTVIRPKSIATVVVVFCDTRVRSSTPTDSTLMLSSVVTGGISDREPTKVVLPTPKPPATRTLSEISSSSAWRLGRVSAGAESIDQSPEDRLAGPAVAFGAVWHVHREVAGVGQVADQHPGHRDRHVQPDADLGDAGRPRAHPDDGPPFHLERGVALPAHGQVRGGDQRLDRQLLPGGAGAPTGEGVHRHDPVPAALVVGSIDGPVVGGHGSTPFARRARGCEVIAWPTRAASMVTS